MNKLIKTICAACTLVLASAGTTLLADSSNFAGPYVAVTAGSFGAQVSGEANERKIDSEGGQHVSSKDQVSAGKVAAVTGFEVGYAFPLGGSFLIDIGGNYLHGAAKLKHETDGDTNSRGNVSFSMNDFVTGYIAPTIVLSDTSSLYVKMGLSEADVGVTGGVTTPGDLSGETWALGTRTVLESGLFIRTEAGYTEYNHLSAHGTGSATGSSAAITSTTSYSAHPTVAYGQVSMGFRF